MARPESRYVCQACAAWTVRWEGQCRTCGAWNTLVETIVSPAVRRSGSATERRAGPVAPDEIPALADLSDARHARRPAGIAELDRVLGGGVVDGSLLLLGGEPGIGKSTLVLALAAAVLERDASDESTVLYASGEESGAQLRLRASRVGLADGAAGRAIRVLAETDVERVVAAADALRPALVVIDSIQTLTAAELDGPPGSVGQVREATVRLQALAKRSGTPVVLVGHVTKDGTLAGPRTLEHLVDVVLTLEGDRFSTLRLLRATKNRFGSTEEVGVFEMTGGGLREVVDPARAFLGAHPATAPGVAIAASLEGSRPLLLEVQALVTRAGGYGMPRRTVSGIDGNRLALLIAVLGRRAGVPIADHDVFASLTGGMSAAEPALDLPLALALASAHRDRGLRPGTVACGEIGLLGELRPVRGLERRLREAERLGFRRAIVPAAPGGDHRADQAAQAPAGALTVVRVATLREAVGAALASRAPSAVEDADELVATPA